ncbi:Dcp1p-Dcp2p decapping enzyme complex alpha subunit [Puccinia graminis f. sp. tritici]|uniref:Dcp1p-Dcp2p decapping enzyme complex alpha subunit n=1 Tax=Puccinia graminis f. sp. tritici TaxID=56615 RepID=A0A5B0R056_PUCGR|nr:Dcp1p-Dcp2p decapping enzyme complex alpha subunit [Puccinia graminis f. sp. tritici]
MHFFMKHASFLRTVTNFDGLSIDKNLSITRIIRNTIESGLIGIVNGSKLTAPLELYNLLKKNCSKLDRRHKVNLINRLMALATDMSPADGHMLSQWATVVAELDQLKVKLEEISGLLLQATFTPPAGVNVKTFEFSVDSQLNAYKTPVFADVSSIIQAATGKLKAKSLSSGPIPMDLDQLQAMQPLKYVTPGCCQAQQIVRPLAYLLTRLPTTKAKASLKPSSIGTAMHVAIAKRKATGTQTALSSGEMLPPRKSPLPLTTTNSGASAHNIKQALAVPDAALWRAAAEYEMLKFGQLEVWVPVVALEMVAGYPLRIPAIRWRQRVSARGCRCPLFREILADIPVSPGIPEA